MTRQGYHAGPGQIAEGTSTAVSPARTHTARCVELGGSSDGVAACGAVGRIAIGAGQTGCIAVWTGTRAQHIDCKRGVVICHVGISTCQCHLVGPAARGHSPGWIGVAPAGQQTKTRASRNSPGSHIGPDCHTVWCTVRQACHLVQLQAAFLNI
jgi:hypothetical protein